MLLSNEIRYERIFKSRLKFPCWISTLIPAVNVLCKDQLVCPFMCLCCFSRNKISRVFYLLRCHIVLCCQVSTASEPVRSIVLLPSSSLTFTSWCEARPPCSVCCLFTPIQGIHLRGHSSNKFTQQPLLSRDLFLPSPLACSFSPCLSPLLPLFFLHVFPCLCSFLFLSRSFCLSGLTSICPFLLGLSVFLLQTDEEHWFNTTAINQHHGKACMVL